MLKIFFVEDDAAIRESIIRNVKWEQHGYEFIGQAPDGEIAYAKMQELRPDVLITDLKMPFMDGLELSRLVRKEMPEVKIIILTGYNDFESVQEALHIGVAKYLLKPVTPEALVKAIVDMRDLVLEEQEHRAFRQQYLNGMAELRDLQPQDFSKIDRTAVGRFLRSGSPSAVEAMVDELVEAAGPSNMQSYLFRQYVLMDISSIVIEFLDSIGVDNSLIYNYFGELKMHVSQLKTVPDVHRYFEELITHALKLRNDTANRRFDGSVEKAQEYIRTNFNNEDISLHAVSKFVNLSPTHFSAIFSKEVGKTFSEFLTEVRIEKAKELLLCTPKRSSEIAYEVGYSDPHYFSYAFKKMTGLSPREFRSSGTES